jgi:hypothetical protein
MTEVFSELACAMVRFSSFVAFSEVLIGAVARKITNLEDLPL